MDFNAFFNSCIFVIFRRIFLEVGGDWKHSGFDIDDGHFVIEQLLIFEILDSHGSTHDD